MKTLLSKIFFAKLACLLWCLVWLPNPSFAVSQDLKYIVDRYYEGADFKQAERKLTEALAENNREENDREYILIYLAILSILHQDMKQADNYLCQLLRLKPKFDPDLSVDDITEKFKERFYKLKQKNRCSHICQGVIREAVDGKLPTCHRLLERRIITSGGEETALSCYKAARNFCQNHPEIKKGFQKMEAFYVNWANNELGRRRYNKVRQALDGLKKVNPQSSAIADIEERLPPR